MTSFKRSQAKHVKKAYRVRNWPQYEQGLRNRGSLTVWLGLVEDKLDHWDAPKPRRPKPGRQRQYSQHAIETAITLGMVFGLASRQTEGFLRSLLSLLKLENRVPDHTTISRRKAKLGKLALGESQSGKSIHILIDSSGLSVHVGYFRKPSKKRDYRKLHICVVEKTGEVVAAELTSKNVPDSSRVKSLLRQVKRALASARADAGYDAGRVYEAVENHRPERSPRVLVHPCKGAVIARASATTRQRNRNIRGCARVGKRAWHTQSGYSKRSKVETTFYRYKTIIGPAMRSRRLSAQRVEA